MLHLFQANQDTLFSGKSAPARGTRFELKNSFNHRKVKSKVSDGPEYHYKFDKVCIALHMMLGYIKNRHPVLFHSHPGQDAQVVTSSKSRVVL